MPSAFIDNTLLVYESRITNHWIAGKVFGKTSEFNIQFYSVLKTFKHFSNSRMCELSKNGVFQSITRAMISFILNG